MTNANATGAAGTTLDAATMRAIRGPGARLALVRAVRDGGLVTTEKDWIEWKSQVDLRDKRSRMEYIVRHILGFANREPDRAARVAEGWAYLLLGVEPGVVQGVQQIDTATLESWLRPYLGWDLRWDADYASLDGKAVLVIWVEAPRWGDPPFPLRKALDPYEDGMIFIRRLGKTERASSAEIDQLSTRATRGAQVLQVSLTCLSSPKIIMPIELREQELQAWIKAERARLTPTRVRQSGGRDTTLLPSYFAITGEDRSRDQFLKEVQDYLSRAAMAWPKRVHRAAIQQGLAAIDLAIQNNTMHNFPALEVRLTFPTAVMPYFHEDDAISTRDIPKSPRPYGTVRLPSLYLRKADYRVSPSILNRSRVEQPSRTIHFEPIDLRPGSHERLDTVHLIVGPEMAGKELIGEWSATSTGVSGKATGTLKLRVGDTPVSWAISNLETVEDAE